MIETQQRILVEDRIHQLRREAAAERAERDHTSDPARVRVGRWLVGMGSAIAGGITPAVARSDDPCDDRPSRLSHAS